jgi:riboflavin kinase/FMN adenylyltransferase
MGIFVARVHGLGDAPLEGVASLGRRPSIDDSGRVLLEVHVFDWPQRLGAEGGYGKLVRVELLAKLRDEARYDSLEALADAIRRDSDDARAWLAAEARSHAATGRQTTRDRI